MEFAARSVESVWILRWAMANCFVELGAQRLYRPHILPVLPPFDSLRLRRSNQAPELQLDHQQKCRTPGVPSDLSTHDLRNYTKVCSLVPEFPDRLGPGPGPGRLGIAQPRELLSCRQAAEVQEPAAL